MQRVGAHRIWVTRTQPAATATADRLVAIGLDPVVAPVLVVHAMADAALDLEDVEALAFTSATAARAFAALSTRRDLTVYAVGKATGEAARSAGFPQVEIGGGDVVALADRIATAKPGPVLIPIAREPAADLVDLLAVRGINARSVIVYETVATEAVAPEGIDSILIHSPRAARIVADRMAPNAASTICVFAISEAAATPLRALPFASIATAAFPDEASLLDLLQG